MTLTTFYYSCQSRQGKRPCYVDYEIRGWQGRAIPSRSHRRCPEIGPSSHLDLRSYARKVCKSLLLSSFILSFLPSFDIQTLTNQLVLSSNSTLSSSSGLKTRHFGTIISELTSCIRTHAASNSRLNGVSLEFTGELTEEGFSVTECLGGSMGLGEEQLGLRYQVRRFRFPIHDNVED